MNNRVTLALVEHVALTQREYRDCTCRVFQSEQDLSDVDLHSMHA
jgi:hypothetical protein